MNSTNESSNPRPPNNPPKPILFIFVFFNLLTIQITPFYSIYGLEFKFNSFIYVFSMFSIIFYIKLYLSSIWLPSKFKVFMFFIQLALNNNRRFKYEVFLFQLKLKSYKFDNSSFERSRITHGYKIQWLICRFNRFLK